MLFRRSTRLYVVHHASGAQPKTGLDSITNTSKITSAPVLSKGYPPAACCRSGDDAEVDILSGAGALLGRNKQLAAGLIETTRLKDANQQEPSKSVVQSVEFHPAGQLLLTAGLDKRLRLFQVLSQLPKSNVTYREE